MRSILNHLRGARGLQMITLYVIVTNTTTVKVITEKGTGFEIGQQLIRILNTITALFIAQWRVQLWVSLPYKQRAFIIYDNDVTLSQARLRIALRVSGTRTFDSSTYPTD